MIANRPYSVCANGWTLSMLMHKTAFLCMGAGRVYAHPHAHARAHLVCVEEGLVHACPIAHALNGLEAIVEGLDPE